MPRPSPPREGGWEGAEPGGGCRLRSSVSGLQAAELPLAQGGANEMQMKAEGRASETAQLVGPERKELLMQAPSPRQEPQRANQGSLKP